MLPVDGGLQDPLHSIDDSEFNESGSKVKASSNRETSVISQISAEHACSGHVESIELVNFMCHRHLLINLNAHINFIVGNNGSGKSAILSALTICLGGRASVTQRASSVDSLIREGASAGKIRIKLNNKGDNPYEPAVFGEHIYIERILKRDGGNSYAILNESGRHVSARKDDINSLCDHFGIQVDNPLAVLTQEVAKKFLASAKPKELYEVNFL